MRKSILFVNPAYHYSFTLKDEFRRMGWRADVYKANGFPQMLLFRDDAIAEEQIGRAGEPKTGTALGRILFFVKLLVRYKYFVVYGDAEVFLALRESKKLRWLFARALRPGRSPELAILTFFGKRIAFFPNGCHQEVLKRDFGLHEGGRVCANCVMSDSVCNDRENQRIFDLVNRYHSLVIANTPMPSSSLPQKRQLKHLALDLEQYHPGIRPSERQKLPATPKLRILHSFVDGGRALGERNFKGSPYVLAAVRRLETEGYPVEYLYLNNIPSREMRFYQVQADIVVDQLIYGWWGSTAIECMGLGKPVVCYLTPSLKQTFLDAFPEYQGLPIVEATTDTIYDVLKKLVDDPAYRERKGRESREFAEQHFDSKKNARTFGEVLLEL